MLEKADLPEPLKKYFSDNRIGFGDPIRDTEDELVIPTLQGMFHYYKSSELLKLCQTYGKKKYWSTIKLKPEHEKQMALDLSEPKQTGKTIVKDGVQLTIFEGGQNGGVHQNQRNQWPPRSRRI